MRPPVPEAPDIPIVDPVPSEATPESREEVADVEKSPPHAATTSTEANGKRTLMTD
jgi:hypothetical protein